MKRIEIFIISLIIILEGCSPTYFFQVYEVNTNQKNTQTPIPIFENEHMIISYNFWAQNGNEDFIIVNKTDSSLFIDLQQSHFIINNYAYTYFQNREWSKSNSIGVSSLYGLSTLYESSISSPINSADLISKNRNIVINSGNQISVTFKEIPVVVIPPHSQKKIDGFLLNDILITNCNVNKYPLNKTVTNIEFTESSTPLKYTNYLTYSFDEKLVSAYVFKNHFWISSISFMPYREFYIKKYKTTCEKRSNTIVSIPKYISPYRFYLRYTRQSNFLYYSNENSMSIKNNTKTSRNTAFKVGDRVHFQDAFKSFDGEIIKIEYPYYYIKYKTSTGKDKVHKATIKGIKKI